MSTEIASFNLGGSYFGPTAEEVMLDPDSANAAEAAAKEEEEAKK